VLNGEASLGSKGVLSSKRLLRAKRDSLGNEDGIGIAEESLPLHVWAIPSNGQSRAGRSEWCQSWIGIQQKCSLEGHSRAAM
jgi:hypothetical protein